MGIRWLAMHGIGMSIVLPASVTVRTSEIDSDAKATSCSIAPTACGSRFAALRYVHDTSPRSFDPRKAQCRPDVGCSSERSVTKSQRRSRCGLRTCHGRPRPVMRRLGQVPRLVSQTPAVRSFVTS